MIYSKTYFCIMEKPIVKLLNLELLEPGTFISNLFLATACYLYFLSLKKVSTTRFHKYLSYYFLLMAFSSFIGAFAHSLYLYTGKTLHLITWILTGLATFYIQYGLSPNLKHQEKFLNFSKVQLILFIILVTFFLDFFVTKINIALGLLGIVVPILLIRVFKYKENYYLYSVFGIFTAIIPALFHRVNYTFAGIFNMNDLSHFVLIINQFFLFFGLRLGITVKTEVYSEAKI